jgi:serine-type D-Ala-D-Ala carboxypeptidase
LLGEVVHRASGVPVDEYLHSRVFAMLGMKDTGFRPGSSKLDRIAPTANERMRQGKTLRGDVHDENSNALGGVAGHAGLFGTASDLAILATALLGNGHIGDYRLLGQPTLELIRRSQIGPEIGGHTIGWFAPPNGMLPRGDLFDNTTFGHTGFTGTMLVCNPTTQLATILLTNRVMNPADGAGIAAVRRKVLNAVASSVVE